MMEMLFCCVACVFYMQEYVQPGSVRFAEDVVNRLWMWQFILLLLWETVGCGKVVSRNFY